jgi:hypothetical protein
MNLDTSLFLCFILFLADYFFLVYLSYNFFSAFFLAYLVSWLLLNFIYPPTSDKLNDITSSTFLYFLFQFIGFFIIFVYSITMAINDYKK